MRITLFGMQKAGPKPCPKYAFPIILRVVYASIGGGTYKVTVYIFFCKNHTFSPELSPLFSV